MTKEDAITWWMKNRGMTQDQAAHAYETHYGLDDSGFLPCKNGIEAYKRYVGDLPKMSLKH